MNPEGTVVEGPINRHRLFHRKNVDGRQGHRRITSRKRKIVLGIIKIPSNVYVVCFKANGVGEFSSLDIGRNIGHGSRTTLVKVLHVTTIQGGGIYRRTKHG